MDRLERIAITQKFNKITSDQITGGFDSPSNFSPNSGLLALNEKGFLGSSPASILDGPMQCNGTIFIDSILFWNRLPLSSNSDPIQIYLRLPTPD